MHRDGNRHWIGLGYEPVLSALEEQEGSNLERVTTRLSRAELPPPSSASGCPWWWRMLNGSVTRQLIYIDAGVKLTLLPELESDGTITSP